MNQYISDTKDAASRLVEAIFIEEVVLARVQAQRELLLADLDHMGKTFNFLELNPDLDDDGLATAIYWEAYDLSPTAGELESKVDELQTRIGDRKVSACALSGALLHIGKQGISIAYKGIDICPGGRMVGKTPLKSVIWEARNQSLHFEEGSFKRKQIYTVFAQLEKDFGSNFKIVPGKNLGYEVVNQLGWTTYAQYEKDMLSLLP